MSIVVAMHRDGRTVMGADTLTVFGDSECVPAENNSSIKCFRLGNSIFGGTGWALYDDILIDYLADKPDPDLTTSAAIFAFFMDFWRALRERYTLVNEQAANRDAPFGDLDSSFLIANRGGIFKISSDMGITRFNHYYAIGSGAEFALGALHVLRSQPGSLENLVRQAVETAMTFDLNSGGTCDILAVE
jgi:ATP-dependent HslUV protease subunit HslV